MNVRGVALSSNTTWYLQLVMDLALQAARAASVLPRF
jgi:hypothetical protein